MTLRNPAANLRRSVNLAAIQSLASFTDRPTIDLRPSAGEPSEATVHPPLATYISQLAHQTKPETASEHLFREVAKDVLEITMFSQVNIGEFEILITVEIGFNDA